MLYELTDKQVKFIFESLDLPDKGVILGQEDFKPVTWANQPKTKGYNKFHPDLKAAYLAGMSQGAMNSSPNNF